MKKVIAAAAGLMLAGTMATAAVADEAGIKWKGDARARYYYQTDYDFDGSENNIFNSRVRLQFDISSKGGAYAVGRFRLGDSTWDGAQRTGAGGEGSNLRVDKAYIGVPFGPVTIEAGLMYRSITEFLYWDILVDSITAKYVADNTTFLAFYHKEDEFEEDNPNDASDDNDVDAWGVWLNQKFDGGWALTASAVIVDDQQADEDGIMAAIHVDGAVGAVALGAEIAYKEADLQASDDDGLGGYVSATLPIGAASVTGVVGFTADGFVADGDFGPFIMLSGLSQISTGIGIGSGGDTFFVAVAPTFKATEKLTLGAVAAFADQDDAGDAFEIGATASYAVVDGAKLNAVVGYLDLDEADENPFGFGLSLEISY